MPESNKYTHIYTHTRTTHHPTHVVIFTFPRHSVGFTPRITDTAEITDHTYVECQFPLETDYIRKTSIATSCYPCCSTRKRRWGILKGPRPNLHEQKAIFVTIKQNDIDRYTIRKSRSVVSLHPIVHRYTILNRPF